MRKERKREKIKRESKTVKRKREWRLEFWGVRRKEGKRGERREKKTNVLDAAGKNKRSKNISSPNKKKNARESESFDRSIRETICRRFNVSFTFICNTRNKRKEEEQNYKDWCRPINFCLPHTNCRQFRFCFSFLECFSHCLFPTRPYQTVSGRHHTHTIFSVRKPKVAPNWHLKTLKNWRKT